MQVKKQQLEWDMEQFELIQNWERSMSRLYVVTLFNLYAANIMGNAGLDEAQAGIKIARRNINNPDMHMTSSLWWKAKRN